MLSHKLILFVFLFLSACQYHLRGDIQLPKDHNRVYLEAASDNLQREINTALKFFSTGKLVDSAAEAAVIVKIADENLKTWILSMNSAGQSNELQLVYQLNFSVYDSKGKPLLEQQKVKVKLEYFNDQTQILGKTNEESVIRAEMYKQAANSIIAQLNTALEANSK